MSATVRFTSSDTFLTNDSHAESSATVEIEDYIEGTYEYLRTLDGRIVATFVDSAWELEDGRRFSDWAVGVR